MNQRKKSITNRTDLKKKEASFFISSPFISSPSGFAVVLGFVFLTWPLGSWAGGASHGTGGVPVGLIVSQVVNLSLLVGAIYFWQGARIRGFFKNHRESFLEKSKQAQGVLEQAQGRLDGVKKRIQDLDQDHEKDISEARMQSQKSYERQLQEAQREAQGVQDSAQLFLDNEARKQVESLRREVFEKSQTQAQKQMASSLNPGVQRAWMDSFMKQLAEKGSQVHPVSSVGVLAGGKKSGSQKI